MIFKYLVIAICMVKICLLTQRTAVVWRNYRFDALNFTDWKVKITVQVSPLSCFILCLANPACYGVQFYNLSDMCQQLSFKCEDRSHLPGVNNSTNNRVLTWGVSFYHLFKGLLVHFTGFVSPYWNILPNEELNDGTETIIRIGLWKICHRVGTKNKCVEYNDPPGQIEAVRLFETVTVILYLLSLLMIWLYRRHPDYGNGILIACMVFIILIVESTAIGGLLWVTVKKIQQKHKLSWAFGLTVASVVFPVISGWFVSNERNSFVQQQRRNSIELSEKRNSFLH